MSHDLDDPAASPAERAPDAHAAEALRAELRQLRRDLAQVQSEFDDTKAAQLLEANEKLVLAALGAERIAEEAMFKLGELTLVTQRDALTDTPNRALMMDRLQNAIALAKRHATRVAVLFVDIDAFKQINDTHGHGVGDEVLQRVARRLEAAVRGSDTVSRHSGDEFLVLLTDISGVPDTSLIAGKMLAALATVDPTDTLPVPVSASIGVALYPDDADDPATLIALADAAMYRAKRHGGATFRFHATASVPDTGCPGPGSLTIRTSDTGGQDLREVNEQLVLSSLALQASEAHAVQAYQQQVKFLAIVAHELRNPLTPIRTATELLNRVRTDALEHERLREMIKRQVDHMTRIVDDLLDSSKAHGGRFHLEFTTVDLVDVLRWACDSCQPGIDARLQRLKVQIPGVPIGVHGDPVRLAQVFRNLLENASKYTHKGGCISVTAVAGSADVVVTVSDDGIGIAADAVPHVFDLFMRESREVSVGRSKGLGIGLAVVRELVDAHGGSVAAASRGRDRGSEFIVKLPLQAVDGPPGAA